MFCGTLKSVSVFNQRFAKDGIEPYAEIADHLAALSFRRAWNLAFSLGNWKLNNECHRRHNQFWRSLLQRDPQREHIVSEFAEEFNGTPFDHYGYWKPVIPKYVDQIPELSAYSKEGGMRNIPEDLWIKLIDVADKESTRYWILSEFTSKFQHSKCMEFVERDAFEVIAEPDAWYDQWSVDWSSTIEIEHNKRKFKVLIHAEDTLIHEETVFGRPTAKRVIDILFQAITYSNVHKEHYLRPRSIRFSWRLHGEFDEIQQEMGKVQVQCHLESRAESEMICQEMGTDVYGYNHL